VSLGLQVVNADARHQMSMAYLQSLSSLANRAESMALLKQFNAGGTKLCRLMFLSDATGSMGNVWESAKYAIQRMIERIMVVTDQKATVEMMWVAFWDYDASVHGHPVTKHSQWTQVRGWLGLRGRGGWGPGRRAFQIEQVLISMSVGPGGDSGLRELHQARLRALR
jgi:hypothetical protein